jgi:hypothetical protein
LLDARGCRERSVGERKWGKVCLARENRQSPCSPTAHLTRMDSDAFNCQQCTRRGRGGGGGGAARPSGGGGGGGGGGGAGEGHSAGGAGGGAGGTAGQVRLRAGRWGEGSEISLPFSVSVSRSPHPPPPPLQHAIARLLRCCVCAETEEYPLSIAPLQLVHLLRSLIPSPHEYIPLPSHVNAASGPAGSAPDEAHGGLHFAPFSHLHPSRYFFAAEVRLTRHKVHPARWRRRQSFAPARWRWRRRRRKLLPPRRRRGGSGTRRRRRWRRCGRGSGAGRGWIDRLQGSEGGWRDQEGNR